MSWCWRRTSVLVLKKDARLSVEGGQCLNFKTMTHVLILKKDECPGSEEGHAFWCWGKTISWFWGRTNVLVLKKDKWLGFEEGHMSWCWRRTHLFVLKKDTCLGFAEGQLYLFWRRTMSWLSKRRMSWFWIDFEEAHMSWFRRRDGRYQHHCGRVICVRCSKSWNVDNIQYLESIRLNIPNDNSPQFRNFQNSEMSKLWNYPTCRINQLRYPQYQKLPKSTKSENPENHKNLEIPS